MCAMTLEREKGQDSCPHASVEILGFDAVAEYARCKACSRILPIQRGQAWAARSLLNPVIAIR